MSDSPPAEAPEPVAPPARPDTTKLMVGLLAIGTAIGGVMLLALVDLPTERAVMVGGFVGSAMTWGGSVVNYYFGSSSGSAAKDATVTRLGGLLGR